MFPYCRGPVDAFMDDSVELIALKFATQLGKTAMLVALLAYVSACDPGPAMIIGPNETSVRELVNTRIYPTFEESASLRHMLLTKHKRRADMIDLGDMMVFCGWSGSPTRLGEKSIRYLWCTEVDKFSKDVTGEADSLSLAMERVKAFPNYKIVAESTPTVDGESRIDGLYQISDQRVYQVPCPHCGTYQELIFEQLQWPHGDDGHSVAPHLAREGTHYRCIKCDDPILDLHKPMMISQGKWVKRGQRVDGGKIVGNAEGSGRIAGFHLSSLYSPLIPFGKVAEVWLTASASHDPGKIQNFQNSWLAMTWTLPAAKTDADDVLAKRGTGTTRQYREGFAPETPRAIIVTGDIQEDGIYFIVRAWCPNGRSYLLRYGYVAGPNDFEKFNVENQHEYEWPNGGHDRPAYVFIDTGYRTKDCYEACARYGWNAMKGHDREGMSQVQQRVLKDTGVSFTTFCAPVFKDRLYSLIHKTPLGGAAAWALHEDAGRDYALQMSAEARQKVRDARGYTRWTWVNPHGRANHYWDCENMNLVAASVLRVDVVDEIPDVQFSKPPPPSRVEPTRFPERAGSMLGYDPLEGMSV